MLEKIHLSVVATSRNDNHGGTLLYRMQKFIDCFVEQCERHKLSAELLIVEWNPPQDRIILREALQWPLDSSFCELRIVTVPPQVHRRLKYSKELPLFQMIAKNVGIRRARGEFILATNIDILFSDEIIIYMRDRLKKHRLYRANRWDVPALLPEDVPLSKLLNFCDKNAFRVHLKGYSVTKPGLNSSKFSFIFFLLYRIIKGKVDRFLKLLTNFFSLENVFTKLGLFCLKLAKFFEIKNGKLSVLFFKLCNLWKNILQFTFKSNIFLLRKKAKRQVLHTNGCGDFTLLSKEDWFNLKGYPEWEMFSWHLDSVLLYQAYYFGIKEIDLKFKNKIFHIEHSIGSGYTEEGATMLFERLEKMKIPYLSYNDLLNIQDTYAEKKFNALRKQNTEFWGMSYEKLEDNVILSEKISKFGLASEERGKLHEELC